MVCELEGAKKKVSNGFASQLLLHAESSLEKLDDAASITCGMVGMLCGRAVWIQK